MGGLDDGRFATAAATGARTAAHAAARRETRADEDGGWRRRGGICSFRSWIRRTLSAACRSNTPRRRRFLQRCGFRSIVALGAL